MLDVGGSLTIGKQGDATLNVHGGSLAAHGTSVDLGSEENSSGELKLLKGDATGIADRTNVTIDGQLQVGIKGEGTVDVDESCTLAAQKISIGTDVHGYGVVNVHGRDATVIAKEDALVGGFGVAEVNVTQGGNFTVAGALTIDSGVPNGASVTVSGSSGIPPFNLNSEVGANEITVGKSGYGSLSVTNQAHVGDTTTKIYVARESNSIGSVYVNSQAVLNAGTFEVGLGGIASVDISSGGAAYIVQSITLGGSSNAAMTTLTMDNGKLITPDFQARRNTQTTLSNAATITINSGGQMSLGGTASHPAMLAVQGGASIKDENLANASTLFLAGNLGRAVVSVASGGSIQVRSLVLGSVGGAGQATMTVDGQTSQVNSASLTINQGSTLTATGGGTIQAQSTANISGTLDVRGGRMLVGPATVDAPQGALTLAPGARLSGSGLIKGNLHALSRASFPGTLAGAFIPIGNSPGTLTVEGDAVLEADTILDMELAGPGSAQHDVLKVTGNAQIDGNVLLKFIDGFAPKIGDQYPLILATNLAVAPNIFVRNLLPGWQYSISQQGGAWTVTSLSNGIFVTPGDFNQNGVVDAADYTVWRDSLGHAGMGMAADADDDGIIGTGDYDIWKANFGGVAQAANFISGDYNDNGIVDAADYTVWRDTLGSSADLRANGDVTGASAGVIDQGDYAVWKSNFGHSAGSGAALPSANSLSAAVPEPTTLVMLLVGMLTLCCRRQVAVP